MGMGMGEGKRVEDSLQSVYGVKIPNGCSVAVEYEHVS